MPRDSRGFWQPERGTAPPSPLFNWPPNPVAVLKWLFGIPGYLFPWNLFYMGLATVIWLYFQPALSRCAEFRADWILQMFVRNQVMLVLIAGGWHLWLWSRKAQGMNFKYTTDWMATGNRKFLWGNQLRDNIFWSCISGGTIWTAYEVLMMWAYVNGKLPYVDPRESLRYTSSFCSAASRCGACSTSTGRTESRTGSRSTRRRIICTTRTSTSGRGRGCPCTRSSMSFTSAAY